MMYIPKELESVVTFPDNAIAPVIKPTATNEQKVMYADFISEYLIKNYVDDEDFLKVRKNKKN